MKQSLPLLRHRLLVLLLAVGACSTFTGCLIEEERRPHHRGAYDHHRDDRRDDYRHDRYDDRRGGDTRYRESSTTYSGGTGTSVTVRRDAPVTRQRTDYYDR